MLVNTQTTHSNPQNFILETGRDWVKSELVLSSSPGTPDLGTYFILILCWRDGQTCTGGRHEEGTRRDKGICKNLLESSSPKLAKITLRHEEISCEHATSYKEPQNHSMAWSGSAEGKELQQLVWILKYVWIKNNQTNKHVFKTYKSAESIKTASEQKQGPKWEPCWFSCFPSTVSTSKGPSALTLPMALGLEAISTEFIYLSQPLWASIQLQQVFWALVTVMKWSDSARLHQRGNIFYLLTETY